MKWSGDEFVFHSFLSNISIMENGCDIAVKKSLMGITDQNNTAMNMLMLLLRDWHEGEKILRDIMPNDGGLSFIPYSLYHSDWLHFTPASGVIPEGQDQRVTLNFNHSDMQSGSYTSYLVISGNQVGGSIQTIPVRIDVGTGVKSQNYIPQSSNLFRNYPNPFNSRTVISYQIAQSQRVEIKIYNALGQNVRVLNDAYKQAGKYSLCWDGKNDKGHVLPSGIYIVQLKAGHFVAHHKLVMLK